MPPKKCKKHETNMSKKIEIYSIDNNKLIRTVIKRDGSTVKSSVPMLFNVTQVTPEDYDLTWLMQKKRPLIENPSETLKLVDLFSGTGPMTLGFVEAGRALGINVIPTFALDFEKTAADNYKANFPECEVANVDINTIIDGDLGGFPTINEQLLIAQLGKIDIVIGGPPCQGHSDLNNHTRRDDPRNQLIFKFVRFVELFAPKCLVIENVQGIRHDKHNVLGVAEEYLGNLGYKLKENLIMASKYGVAQNRRRFLLVGFKDNIQFDLSHYERSSMTSCVWAIDDLRSIALSATSTFDTPAVHSKTNQNRINYLHDNNIYELPNPLRPKCQQKEDNRYTSVYGRMYPDKPAPTITSGFGSIGQGRFGHPYERRTLTPHEAARIQFIPDFFIFENYLNRVSLQTMIGNAVPPKLTYIIGLELLR